MQIRHATVDDAPAMGEVMVASFLTAHKAHYPPALWQRRVNEWTPAISAASWAETLQEIATSREAGETSTVCLYVAVDEKEAIVGLIYGYFTKAPIAYKAEQPQPDEPAVAVGEIGALYIKPEAQGRGIGRQLVRAAATYFGEIGASTLHIGVLAANIDARHFYEAIGGQLISEYLYEEEGVQLPSLVYSFVIPDHPPHH